MRLGLAALLLLAVPLEAARYRVVDENGKPVPAVRVSIQGRAGSVAADPKGELTLDGEPLAPFDVGVFSPSGAWLGLVRVDGRPAGDAVRDLVLPAARNAEVLVAAGTAASLLAPPANAASRRGSSRNGTRAASSIPSRTSRASAGATSRRAPSRSSAASRAGGRSSCSTTAA